MRFETPNGRPVPSVTADEMREVDRVAVDEVGVDVPMMMENAGRTLAIHARDLHDGPVTVLAGGGGNGGGGLCGARHLLNHGVAVDVVLDRPPAHLSGPPAMQWAVLSLDVPSGVDATTGERPGVSVEADHILTLALPKTGLADGTHGDLVLADIAIPAVVYERAGIDYESPFVGRYRVDLRAVDADERR